MRHRVGFLLLATWLAAAALAAQSRQQVTLASGSTLEAERIEVEGSRLILYVDEGQIAVERSEVESVQDLPWVAMPESISTSSPTASEAPTLKALLRQSAETHGLPEAFVASVAETESALQPGAVSPKGARGVMQLMPSTAAALGVDPDEPSENIDGGAKLLRDLLLRYQNHPDQVRLALAAYNAGAGAVQKYGGVPPYRETTAYVERVLQRYRAKRLSQPERGSGAIASTAQDHSPDPPLTPSRATAIVGYSRSTTPTQ